MRTHEPRGYRCPFCRLLRGEETDRNLASDIVYRDAETAAFVSPKWWPRNAGHVLVVPTRHVENVYEIPTTLLARVYATAQAVAGAIAATYGCDGTSMRQHNEPGGQQDVWHFHVHVFPRYVGDELYARHAEARWVEAAEREPYARRLRACLGR